MRVWSIGEVLWDIFPDQERFGGAALNFCANLQRLGDSATLLSAVGDDTRGRLALKRMTELHLDTSYVSVIEGLPTGVAVVGHTPEGEPSFNIPRPAAFDRISVDRSAIQDAQQHGVDWIYFGTLLQTSNEVEQFTTELIVQLSQARRFYDMNLRIGQWSLALVQRLSHLANVLKLNEAEARLLHGLTHPNDRWFSLEEFARQWASTYDIDTICITLGPAGSFVLAEGAVHTVPGYAVTVVDTVGSGDAFAAAFLHGYQQHWPIEQTSRFANALGALVASRAGATPPWTTTEVLAMVQPTGGPRTTDEGVEVPRR